MYITPFVFVFLLSFTFSSSAIKPPSTAFTKIGYIAHKLLLPKPLPEESSSTSCDTSDSETSLDISKSSKLPNIIYIQTPPRSSKCSSCENIFFSTIQPVENNIVIQKIPDNTTITRVSIFFTTEPASRPPSLNKQEISPHTKLAIIEKDGKICTCEVNISDLKNNENTWLIQTPEFQPLKEDDCNEDQQYIIYNWKNTHHWGMMKVKDKYLLTLVPNKGRGKSEDNLVINRDDEFKVTIRSKTTQ